METVRKIIPFEAWQSEWLLRWLHEQSREGWELVDIHRNTATFKSTTHINLTYGLANTEEKSELSEKSKKETPYLRLEKIHAQYEADGWKFVCSQGDIMFLQRTRFDAVPLPPIPNDLAKLKKNSRGQTISIIFTLFLLMYKLWTELHTYPHTLWLIFMILMSLSLAGGLLYLPHVLSKAKDDVHPRDVSQEDYQQHLYRAKTLFLLKSAVFAGNIIGIAAQLIDIFVQEYV